MSYNLRRGMNYNSGMSNRGRPGIQQSFISSGQQQFQQANKQGGGIMRQQTPPQRVQQQHYQEQPYQQQHQQQQLTPMRQPSTNAMPLKSALKKEVKNEPITPQKVSVEHLEPKVTSDQNNVNQQPQKPVIQEQKEYFNQQMADEIKQIVTSLPSPPPPPESTTTQSSSDQEPQSENGDVKKKVIFKGKISKKEKRGRRNKRLRKLLVPKNALMVLNELIGAHKFTFLEEDTVRNLHKASVTVENTDYVGHGKTKAAAKNAAAENALRHVILSKISASTLNKNSEGVTETPMETEEQEKQEEDDVSWMHVASFAMHKLFSSWQADNDPANASAQTGLTNAAGSTPDVSMILPAIKPTNIRRPAKQIPANPEQLNPVMLLHQMRDDIVFEEYSTQGSAPNVIFIMKVTIDNVDYFGRGKTKKIARKNCAYAACTKIYGLTYTPEEFDPNNASIGSV